MYCSNCGKEINENSKFCPECGARISRNEDLNNTPKADAEQTKEISRPEETAQSKQVKKPDDRRINTLCLVGIVLSGLSLVASAHAALILGAAGLIVSYLGYKRMDMEREKGRELAIIGMALGGAVLAMTLISFVVYGPHIGRHLYGKSVLGELLDEIF